MEGPAPALWQVPVLVCRLQSDTLAQRADAAARLKASLMSATNARLPAIAAAVEAAGGIAAALQLLRGGSDGEAALTGAAGVLADLAFQSLVRCRAIIDAGGIACLVQALGSDSERLQAAAASALIKISFNDVAADGAMAAGGVVPATVRLLTSGNATVAHRAAGLLGSMSATRQCQRAVAEAGAIPLAGALLCGHGEDTAAAAARTLTNLAGDDERAAAEAPCIPALTECLRRCRGSAELQREASRALFHLALGSTSRCAAIVAAGGAAAIVQLLARAPDYTSQPNAIKALAHLGQQGQAQAVVAADPSAVVERALQTARACSAGEAWQPFYDESLRRLAEARRAQQARTKAGTAAAAGPAAASTSTAATAAPRPPKPCAPRVCANPECGATTGSLRRCGGCAAVRYCSEACSRAHWRAHKAECRRLVAEQQAAAGGEASGSGGGAP